MIHSIGTVSDFLIEILLTFFLKNLRKLYFTEPLWKVKKLENMNYFLGIRLCFLHLVIIHKTITKNTTCLEIIRISFEQETNIQ